MLLNDVTLGICTSNNTKGLLMSLSSVLLGSAVPAKITVLFTSDMPPFGEFYLEQLADLCKYRGASLTLSNASVKGIRQARQWQLANCTTDNLLTLDDDVIVEHDAIEVLCETVTRNARHKIRWGFVVGNKRDVNNRRGYGDFSQEPVSEVYTNCSTNLYYDKDACKHSYIPCVALDTGFALLNVKELRYSGVKFDYFKVSFNAGGEDNFFGIQCTKAGYAGFFVPAAQAFHLEKPVQRFNEFAARKEAIVRSAEAAGLADGETEHKVFGWVTK